MCSKNLNYYEKIDQMEKETAYINEMGIECWKFRHFFACKCFHAFAH